MKTPTKSKFKEKRRHGTLIGYIVDMHSGENQTSWMRWIGTLIISNIMAMWTFNCVFDDSMKFRFTLEEIPTNLAGIIGLVLIGKVGQAIVDRKNGKS